MHLPDEQLDLFAQRLSAIGVGRRQVGLRLRDRAALFFQLLLRDDVLLAQAFPAFGGAARQTEYELKIRRLCERINDADATVDHVVLVGGTGQNAQVLSGASPVNSP